MFHIALYEPQIAPNTGNIMRLISNNGCRLHLIEPLGFDLDEKKLRRAGLDYVDLERVTCHANYREFCSALEGCRILAFTTKGTRAHSEVNFVQQDVLLFGSETAGLPDELLSAIDPDLRLRIPMQANSRSMNLSNAVAVGSYEAWRQLGFAGSVAATPI